MYKFTTILEARHQLTDVTLTDNSINQGCKTLRELCEKFMNANWDEFMAKIPGQAKGQVTTATAEQRANKVMADLKNKYPELKISTGYFTDKEVGFDYMGVEFSKLFCLILNYGEVKGHTTLYQELMELYDGNLEFYSASTDGGPGISDYNEPVMTIAFYDNKDFYEFRLLYEFLEETAEDKAIELEFEVGPLPPLRCVTFFYWNVEGSTTASTKQFLHQGRLQSEIGLSVSAADSPKERLIGIILHEITHVSQEIIGKFRDNRNYTKYVHSQSPAEFDAVLSELLHVIKTRRWNDLLDDSFESYASYFRYSHKTFIENAKKYGISMDLIEEFRKDAILFIKQYKGKAKFRSFLRMLGLNV